MATRRPKRDFEPASRIQQSSDQFRKWPSPSIKTSSTILADHSSANNESSDETLTLGPLWPHVWCRASLSTKFHRELHKLMSLVDFCTTYNKFDHFYFSAKCPTFPRLKASATLRKRSSSKPHSQLPHEFSIPHIGRWPGKSKSKQNRNYFRSHEVEIV